MYHWHSFVPPWLLATWVVSIYIKNLPLPALVDSDREVGWKTLSCSRNPGSLREMVETSHLDTLPLRSHLLKPNSITPLSQIGQCNKESHHLLPKPPAQTHSLVSEASSSLRKAGRSHWRDVTLLSFGEPGSQPFRVTRLGHFGRLTGHLTVGYRKRPDCLAI